LAVQPRERKRSLTGRSVVWLREDGAQTPARAQQRGREPSRRRARCGRRCAGSRRGPSCASGCSSA
jgi:hypothetical protein